MLFERIGDIAAARNTLIELLDEPRLEKFEQYSQALEKLPELEALLDTIDEFAAQETKSAETKQ